VTAGLPHPPSTELPHQKPDVAGEGFQFLEDLATAYWYSEVLFAALELGICERLARGPCPAEELAGRCGGDLDGLRRLLAALVSLGLVVENDGRFENGPLAANYLVPGGDRYAGDFLRYRRYLVPHWQRLAARVREGVRANERPENEPPQAYRRRVFDYVRAMDVQARIKAAEAMDALVRTVELRPRRILDLGGGAGAWCRAFRGAWPDARAVLLELPETLAAARKLYPDPSSWDGIAPVGGNGLTPCFRGRPFDLILLSNIVHAYGDDEVRQLLADAVRCLAPGGAVLVHDYLADRHPDRPLKGRLYDLHMLLNTYNGRVYPLRELAEILDASGLKSSRLWHLRTDTSLLLARRQGPIGCRPVPRGDMHAARAAELGFAFARVLAAGEIAIEPWVRLKCRFGCSRGGSALTCPPFSPDEEKMRALLSRYTHALLVQGTPPSKRFHERLLALEKAFLLDGHPEALAFGAGPCPVCPGCPTEGRCRFPELARPSLEACGVDVYATSRRAGLELKPVAHRRGYVKYVGLVLYREEQEPCASC
jgi:predicted metal-binding protein/ubiquinone/menaquinone biosynthesis C-methylase UbiE